MSRPYILAACVFAFAGFGGLACGNGADPAPEATPFDFPSIRGELSLANDDAATSAAVAESDAIEKLPQYLTLGWDTDFSLHSVPYKEIVPGGPGRDGVQPIDDPDFVLVSEAPDYMRDDEAVISLDLNGDARAYPLAILISHEIVNDRVGGVSVAVTYCPLCNSGVVFDRQLDGAVLDFGTTGNVRNSDLIMWDRQTQSWWQQITGEAIVGELTGAKLDLIPAQMVSWRDFKQSFPNGRVLSRDLASGRNYDRPPYGGYDLEGSAPAGYKGDTDARLGALERVLALSFDEEAIAYPFSLLREHPVLNDSFAGHDLVIFFVGGTLSPFPEVDSSPDPRFGIINQLKAKALAELPEEAFIPNRPVGSSAVYRPELDGRKLTFEERNGTVVDIQTGSTWNVLGLSVAGPLRGRRLTPVLHGNHFWFAWAAFFPETQVRSPEDLG